MPTANSFIALGRGNGLGTCISRNPLNHPTASNTRMWTTLAGVNSNNPVATQNQIDESLRLAYKLVYNTYQFLGSCRSFSEDSNTPTLNWDNTVNNIVLKKSGPDRDAGNNASNPSEPIDRVCNSASNLYITDDIRTKVQANMPNSIGIMTHNGESLDNGGQLMGYSVFGGSVLPLCAFHGNRSFSASARVFLQTTDYDLQDNSLPDDEQKNAFVQLGGMHFIAKCFSDGGSSAYVEEDRILEPENLLAQSRATSSSRDRLSRAQITGIDFYTYN